MKALGVLRHGAIGATVVFGFAQIWAAYHLSARLHLYSQAGQGVRWLLVGAVLLMVAAEVLTALVGVRQKRF